MAAVENEMITRRQYFFFIIQTLIGVGVLTLPYNLHQVAKQDGWISLLISGVIIQLVLILMWALARRFPQQHLFEYIPSIVGKFFGGFLNFLLILYSLAVAGVILLLFDEMIRTWLLPKTPYWIISLMFIALGIYLVSGKIKVMARLYVFVSLLLPILVVLLLYAAKDGQWVYMLPIGESGLPSILKGVYQSSLSMLGYLIVLLLFPYTKGTPKQKLGTISLANGFVVFFYFLTVFLSFIYFGTEEMKYVSEPVLYMLKAVELPIISRIDMFFISIWIVSVATTLCSYLLLASKGVTQVFSKISYERAVLGIGGVLFCITYFTPKDESWLNSLDDYVSFVGMWFGVGLPIFLLIISLLFKKKSNAGGQGYEQKP
ncbi:MULTISPECIES: GerAB/ArcD/ProY family transporter [Pontibacillus]|uniref:GerAB/ArcD/ProY family transporter n=1 Tax=Pontibacillus chungwhensis TaxID=265426 RepID=A0ABY8V1A1_9BACI|nr:MULTISPECIES: GerAB/ArcD/ProY family transporter [Pontibacillus]MCD5324817.1 spore germination protein [Pontibacillus sp. HN14]WIF98776.1 GerAB/ArcD/ProY family transporter [Pontibacillus chungwhensis]